MPTYEIQIYYIILTGVVLVALILVFFLRSITRYREIQCRAYEEKVKADISSLEAERKRIAIDLHDDMGPLLSAIKMQVNSLNGGEEDCIIKQNIKVILKEGMEKVRHIANQLTPPILLEKGLCQAVREFAGQLIPAGSLKVQVNIAEEIETVNKDYQVHIFRIIQEVANNCIKHADATILLITMEEVNRKIVIKTIDDGVGFNTKKVRTESKGFGIKNILTRVELMNGELYLDSGPGKGVSYTIILPQQKKSVYDTDSNSR